LTLLPHPPLSPPFPYTTLFRSRSVAGRSESGPEQKHSARPGIVPRRLRKPRTGNDQFHQGTSTGDDPGLSRPFRDPAIARSVQRSEEHTSELQSQSNLVCRLLL